MMTTNEKKKINEYRKALAELDEIFDKFEKEIKNKVPESFRKFVKDKKDKNYKFEYDDSKELKDQNILRETKVLLSIIYRSYFCSEEEKKRLELEDEKKLKRIEDEIREKYNPDNLFKKKENIQEENKEELQLVEVKESIFKKIINKMKEIFVR